MEEYLVVNVFVCLIVPMIFVLGFQKGNSRVTLGYMIIGITIGLVASQTNAMILSSGLDRFYVITNITPACEEFMKALPVLFFCFAVSSKAERIVPAAASVGFGFALFENITVLFQAENFNLFWVFNRGIGAGLMHAICTSAVGLGMSIVGYRKRLFIPGTFSLLSMAIIYHGIFNSLVETEQLKYIGIFLPIVSYIPILILLKKRWEKTKSK